MAKTLENINVFNQNLAVTFLASQTGMNPKDIEQIPGLLARMCMGDLDVILITLDTGVDPNSELIETITNQLNRMFHSDAFVEREPFSAQGANYTGLHIDATRDLYGQYRNDIDLRLHFNPGGHKKVNCPPSRDTREFEPYFIFGRVDRLEIYPQTLVQSYAGFRASLAVNLMQPTWNIFRAHGRMDANGWSRNVPVTHSVVPRVMAEDILDPAASFTPLMSGDVQTCEIDGRKLLITPYNRSPYADDNGIELGFSRSFTAFNHSFINPSQHERSLVA